MSGAERGRLPEKWYRQFWPWFLIAIPGSAVVLGLTMLYVSTRDWDGMAVGEYYKEGLAINQVLAREEVARQLGLACEMRLDPLTGTVTVGLEAERMPADPELVLTLHHATRPQHDRTLDLRAYATAQYTGQLERALPPGAWNLSLEPPGREWRVTGRMHVTPATEDVLQVPLSP